MHALSTTAAAVVVHQAGENLEGLAGWVADVITALGAPGVFFLLLLETIVPPIPSEVVLPFAGYLAYGGAFSAWTLLLAATLGSLAGAAFLYGLGAAVGVDRARVLLGRIPLVDEEDVRKAEQVFRRHGRPVVLYGRMMPIARSLVSVPAGATRMPLWQFVPLTLVGSAIWNAALIGGGYALGTQWRTVERWAGWLQWVVLAAAVVAVVVFVVRRIRARRP